MNNTSIINKLEKIKELEERKKVIEKIDDLIQELRIETATKEVKNASFKNALKKYLKGVNPAYNLFVTPWKEENNYCLCNRI